MIRTPEEIDGVLAFVGQQWKKFPQLRLGQLLVDCTTDTWHDPYYISEVELMDNLARFERLHKDALRG